ncbi:MAG: hypothetical protein K2Q13_10020 [Nitrosomonas sp.]|uniref:hypothetical protein n=1 Tax=Nitrosomonas sp. TaxID=42353 RepID=UPI0025D77F09|nr:hypothetical protein [Nitrosomonas sp.]MBY0475377.1 hypothetical protein [Nitrosomonas sp.]
MATITGNDIQDMVSHWLKTPTNGYLGSDYGQDIKSLLQNPQSSGEPEAVLQKLRVDVPVIQSIPDGSVNLYSVQTPPDRLDLVIEVAGQGIQVPGL